MRRVRTGREVGNAETRSYKDMRPHIERGESYHEVGYCRKGSCSCRNTPEYTAIRVSLVSELMLQFKLKDTDTSGIATPRHVERAFVNYIYFLTGLISTAWTSHSKLQCLQDQWTDLLRHVEIAGRPHELYARSEC